jgi:hypothetical protein
MVYPSSILLLLSLASSTASQYHNLVRNGDFEAAPCPSEACVSDYSSFGWTGHTQGNLIEVVTPKSGFPMAGARAVSLNTDFPYTMSQTIGGFIPGETYTLFFDLGTAPCQPEIIKQMYARFGGSASIHQPSANFEVTWDGMDRKEFTFIAFGTEHSLFLGSLSGGSCGPIIDNVVIIPSPASTPEPVGVNILVNGDFESGIFANCKDDSCIMSTSTIAPWMTTHNPNGEAAIKFQRVSPGSGMFSPSLTSF